MDANISYYLRKEQGQNQLRGPAQQEKDDTVDESERAIRCKACGLPVTSRAQKITISNSHTHTFFNPAGIVFELACFRRASGCMLAGEATSEFTWFAGFLWRYALCRNCNNHVGWFYQGAGSSFFGLILRNLVED